MSRARSITRDRKNTAVVLALKVFLFANSARTAHVLSFTRRSVLSEAVLRILFADDRSASGPAVAGRFPRGCRINTSGLWPFTRSRPANVWSCDFFICILQRLCSSVLLTVETPWQSEGPGFESLSLEIIYNRSNSSFCLLLCYNVVNRYTKNIILFYLGLLCSFCPTTASSSIVTLGSSSSFDILEIYLIYYLCQH